MLDFFLFSDVLCIYIHMLVGHNFVLISLLFYNHFVFINRNILCESAIIWCFYILCVCVCARALHDQNKFFFFFLVFSTKILISIVDLFLFMIEGLGLIMIM